MTEDYENHPVKAKLEVRRNVDGVIRTYRDDWDYYGDFIWMEGNFACDCNRHLFFCRAAGEDEGDDEDENNRCGRDRYAVRLTDSNGDVLYEDFSDNEKRA